ncbi:MAG TPA: 50S ribosomal protein L25/general stress protein Ctc [Candidatus Avibacteroides avistercoris]|uniref:Large ribosomal subunit protein bL25 n=1 Tax=Candidatus Avibacteroides avistercoris TaxID=2840690 RepID=A0A9D2ZUA4_9BACT|nr:50S ribosomal protein L25/general stress protein Ctc [Candidatus Avibacteroides avistercoris]
MKTIQINATARNEYGKKVAKHLRKEGKVPCVVYGLGEHMDITVSEDELRKLIYTPHIYIVELNIDGKIYPTVLKDAQYHPVKDNVLHVDFLRINEEKPVEIEIPVVLDGLAEGVRAGGKMNLRMRKLRVKGIFTNIPERLHIDVTKLGLGKSIQVGELSFEGLELTNAKESVVCAVQLTRAARGAQAAAANS